MSIFANLVEHIHMKRIIDAACANPRGSSIVGRTPEGHPIYHAGRNIPGGVRYEGPIVVEKLKTAKR